MSHTGNGSKCANCGKRVYEQVAGRYQTKWWQHASGNQECAGLMCKYATPAARLAEGAEA